MADTCLECCLHDDVVKVMYGLASRQKTPRHNQSPTPTMPHTDTYPNPAVPSYSKYFPRLSRSSLEFSNGTKGVHGF